MHYSFVLKSNKIGRNPKGDGGNKGNK